MAQAITTKAQDTTTQSQVMTAQSNWEVIPRAHQQIATITSRLRDFTKINPPTFYESKVEEDPKISLMKSTRSIILWGCLLVRRPS